MKKFNPHGFDPSSIDKSRLGVEPDTKIARSLGVRKDLIRYWRIKWGIPSYEENRDRERQSMFDDGYHWCSKCEQFLPLDNFNKNKRNRFGLKTHCNACRLQCRQDNAETISQKHRKKYIANRTEIRAKQTEYRNRNRKEILKRMNKQHTENKAWCVNLFGGSCMRCGYDEFNTGLEFHHVNPDEKEFTPTQTIASNDRKKMQYELDKCVMLCRNCHMSFHAGDWTADFEKRDTIGWKIKQ